MIGRPPMYKNPMVTAICGNGSVTPGSTSTCGTKSSADRMQKTR